MKALVTGGTGFIGSHLVDGLLAQGVEVRCLVRKTSPLRWLKGLPVELVYGDCTEKTSLREAVRDVDQVFHLAGVTKAVNDETYFRVNAEGTGNLIQACLVHNPRLRRFIYLSSQAAAGPSQNGCKKTEADACTPVSAYGRSKREGEEWALVYARELPLVILRPPAVYGPRETDIYTYIKLLSKRIQPCLSGAQPRFSLCYVEDLIRALLLASSVKLSNGEVFFLSDGTDYLWTEIGDIFAKALGVQPVRICVPRWAILGVACISETFSKISRKPALLNRGKVEEMRQRSWVCDVTKARNVLCFQPCVTLEEGAQYTVDWYRKENWL